jgi:hypothetical protein
LRVVAPKERRCYNGVAIRVFQERDAWTWDADRTDGSGKRRHRRQGGGACRDGDFVRMIPLAHRDAKILQFPPFRVARLALIRAIRREERATCWLACATRAAPMVACPARCLASVYERHN